MFNNNQQQNWKKILLVAAITVTFPMGIVSAQSDTSIMKANTCTNQPLDANEKNLTTEKSYQNCGECLTDQGLPGFAHNGICHRC